MTIAICGAAGKMGQQVIEQLLKRINTNTTDANNISANNSSANNIVVIARHAQTSERIESNDIEVRHADYLDVSSLQVALSGIDQILLISSSEVGTLAEPHFNVIAAAQRAGIKHFVYTSLLHADQSGIAMAQEHLLTEQALFKSGLTYTILRNGWYTENYTANLKTVLDSGTLIGAAGDGKISSALMSEYAEAAAIVLTTHAHENKVYELAGDEAYTLAELAAEVSRQTDKNIVYLNLDEPDYRERLIHQGAAPALANLIVNADMGAANGALFDDSGTLQELLGRKTTSLEQAVKNALE